MLRPRILGKPEKVEIVSKPRYERVPSLREYHSNRWTRESREFRRVNPICRMCESVGIIRAAQVTDHIIPAPVCKDFWDRSNWQALCTKCNAKKGNADKELINRLKYANR